MQNPLGEDQENLGLASASKHDTQKLRIANVGRKSNEALLLRSGLCG